MITPTRRRVIAWLTLVISGGFVALVLLNLLGLALTSRPLHEDMTRDESTVSLTAAPRTIGFEGDCVHFQWDAQKIWAIWLNDQAIPGVGSDYPCIFVSQTPTFTVHFPTDTKELYPVSVGILYPSIMRPVLVLAAALAGLAALYLMTPDQRARWMSGWRQYLTALILAFLTVMAIDVLTNSLDIFKLRWDHLYYIGLAVDGYTPTSPWFAEPFIYRYSPMLARALMDAFSISFPMAFTIIAYVGAVGQLWGMFALAKALGANFRVAMVALSVVALSFFNVKFLVFDVYRPDVPSLALMTWAMVALVKRRWGLCLILSSAALMFREFAVLMYPLLALALLIEVIRTRRYALLLWMPVFVAVAAASYLIPRQMFTSETTYQVVTGENWQTQILALANNANRNLNLIIIITSYCLPLMLLSTPRRWKKAWPLIRPYAPLLLCYTVGFAPLMFIGGGDINRFMAFFVFVQIPLLVFLLSANAIPMWEMAYVLLAMLLLNRTLLMIPVDSVGSYLEFLVAHSDERNASTIPHLIEPFLYWAALLVLRGIDSLYQGKMKRTPIES